jgi:hypothetical protein
MKRPRDLNSFPKPQISLQRLALLKRNASLRKYKEIIENIGGDGIRFYQDTLHNRGFFYNSENSPTLYTIGHNNDHGNVDVYRKLKLPNELAEAIESKCVEFS